MELLDEQGVWAPDNIHKKAVPVPPTTIEDIARGLVSGTSGDSSGLKDQHQHETQNDPRRHGPGIRAVGRILPLLLQTLLVVALDLLAGSPSHGLPRPPAPADARHGPLRPGTRSPALAAGGGPDGSKSDGIQPLTAAAPVPEPGSLAAQLGNPWRRRAGAAGSCRARAPGRSCSTAPGDTARVPASNMKLLTAAAALRTLGPERRFSTTAVAGAAPRVCGADGRRGRAPGRGRISPRGPCWGVRGSPAAWRRPLSGPCKDGVSVHLTVLLQPSPLHRPRAEPGLEPGGHLHRLRRCRWTRWR